MTLAHHRRSRQPTCGRWACISHLIHHTAAAPRCLLDEELAYPAGPDRQAGLGRREGPDHLAGPPLRAGVAPRSSTRKCLRSPRQGCPGRIGRRSPTKLHPSWRKLAAALRRVRCGRLQGQAACPGGSSSSICFSQQQRNSPERDEHSAVPPHMLGRLQYTGGGDLFPLDEQPRSLDPQPPPPTNPSILSGLIGGSGLDQREGSVLIGRTGAPFVPKAHGGRRSPPIDWDDQMSSGTVAQICHLMSSYGSKLAWTHAHDCLCAARVHCLAQRQHELVRQKGHESVVDCMRAHPTSELVQRAGCEVLGLLAGGPNGLQQVVFEAGALPAVLDACEVFFESEGVLGAAFHTISNMCAAAGDGDDPEGCMRKQCAVELHALEVISEGMVSVPRANGCRRQVSLPWDACAPASTPTPTIGAGGQRKWAPSNVLCAL